MTGTRAAAGAGMTGRAVCFHLAADQLTRLVIPGRTRGHEDTRTRGAHEGQVPTARGPFQLSSWRRHMAHAHAVFERPRSVPRASTHAPLRAPPPPPLLHDFDFSFGIHAALCQISIARHVGAWQCMLRPTAPHRAAQSRDSGGRGAGQTQGHCTWSGALNSSAVGCRVLWNQ